MSFFHSCSSLKFNYNGLVSFNVLFVLYFVCVKGFAWRFHPVSFSHDFSLYPLWDKTGTESVLSHDPHGRIVTLHFSWADNKPGVKVPNTLHASVTSCRRVGGESCPHWTFEANLSAVRPKRTERWIKTNRMWSGIKSLFSLLPLNWRISNADFTRLIESSFLKHILTFCLTFRLTFCLTFSVALFLCSSVAINE